MDPLSITASILVLPAAVHATTKGIREIGSMCKAPQLIKEISDELRYLELLLRQIENFDYNNRLLDHVDVLLDPLIEAKKELTVSMASCQSRLRLGWAKPQRVA